MALTTYVMLLFGIGIALWFIGYSPLVFSMLGCDTTDTTCEIQKDAAVNFLNGIIDALINNPLALAGIAGVLVLGYLLGGSFIVNFLAPVVILLSVSNIFLLPTEFFFDNVIPFEIRLIIFGFLQLLLFLSIITFIRGGDA